MTFDEIYKLVHDFTDIELKISDLDVLKKTNKQKQEIEKLSQQLIEIKFRLELPYKILDLIQEASKEDISIQYGRKDEDFSVIFRDVNNRYSNYYLSLLSNQTEYYEAIDLLQSIKNKRLEEERKQQLKELALSKLTKEEKEILGLN